MYGYLSLIPELIKNSPCQQPAAACRGTLISNNQTFRKLAAAACTASASLAAACTVAAAEAVAAAETVKAIETVAAKTDTESNAKTNAQTGVFRIVLALTPSLRHPARIEIAN
jgi:hypothetical protein